MATRARLLVTLGAAGALAAVTAAGCKHKPAAPAPAPVAAPPAAARAPVPASVWQRPSVNERWEHARRAQASVDKWFKAVAAGDFQSIRALYVPSGFRGAREDGKPVTDVAAWLALREKEHRAGRVLDIGRKPELTPSNIDNDKVWLSFLETVTSGRRREHRRRRLVFQGGANPLIVSEWEGPVQPSWPEEQIPREIPLTPRTDACPGSLALDASSFWIVAGEEATHAAATARLTSLRAAGRQAEVVLVTAPDVAPARFLIVTGVASDRSAADAAAARDHGTRVVEPAQLPTVGRGDALRFAGRMSIGDGNLVLVSGRTFWVCARIGLLRRYHLDGDRLTLVSELSLGLPPGAQEVWFGERDGAPHMKTKTGWVRIDPETGEQTPVRGDPPPIAGAEAAVGDRRFTVDRARPGIAIARGGAPESFIPFDLPPSVFAASTPGGPRLVTTGVFGDNGPALFEVTAERPAARVAKLCGELIWSAGHGIAEQPFAFKDTLLATAARGAYEIWLPANRYLPIPHLPGDQLACADADQVPEIFLPPHYGTMLWEGGARQTYVVNCDFPKTWREAE